ncbi:MAG: hypothetical protein N2438_13150 [Limisphaera sp.]|nr:hypothetical protein [Limisphaera sp.]
MQLAVHIWALGGCLAMVIAAWGVRAADPGAGSSTAEGSVGGPAAALVQRPVDTPGPDSSADPNRSSTRAFWGAPPLMPHAFAGDRDGRYCLECHAREDRIEKRQRAIAPVPHAEFTQCQQCHVSGVQRDLPPFRENVFTGRTPPGKGSRAHPWAPPTVPHGLFMRENCLSCHGPAGHQRIATSHPWRSQCLQCHVAEADREPGLPVMVWRRDSFP